MPKHSQFPGVEGRGTSIRIRFNFRGETCREKLELKDTPRNRRIAYQKLEDINRQILLGEFDYAREFPNSKTVEALNLRPIKRSIKTFEEMAAAYLNANSHLAVGTLNGYQKALRRYWLPRWDDRPIDEIPYSEIAETVGQINWSGPKNRNNALIPLRGIFDMAWMDELIPSNPTSRIKNQRNQKSPPDPFSLDEANQIISFMCNNFNKAIWNYFDFAFFTGVRPEEQISLKWGDVDWNNKTIRIQRARSSGVTKTVKNEKVRDVDLNSRALDALMRQKNITVGGDHIFLNPVTDKPWNDNGKAQRVRYWIPALEACGIRYRRPYNYRHTYASMLLMADNKPAYAASQMGHSITVFLSVYARWIDSDGQNAEKGKLDSFINTT